MSLMGSVAVTLYVLCWLLVASSSTSVSRNLVQISPASQFNNNTTPICPECSNGSTSLNSSSQTSRRSSTHPSSPLNTSGPNQHLHDADLLNKGPNGLFNQNLNHEKLSLSSKINNSTSQFNISLTPKNSTQDISPPAKVNDSPTGPGVKSAPLSHTNKNELRSYDTTTQVLIPAVTTKTTLTSTTAATSIATISPPAATSIATVSSPATNTTTTTTTTTSTTSTTTTTTSTTSTTSSTTSTTSSPPTLSLLSTAVTSSTHASTTIAPAPNIVKTTAFSTSSKTTGSRPMELETTTTTTATTITITSSSTAFVSTNSSSTAHYSSPVVEVVSPVLVDKASLLAILLFGLLFFFVVVAVFVTQAYESYRRKDYTQVDYLINGMYTDSGV